MPDPILGTVIAKAIDEAQGDNSAECASESVVVSLVKRMFEPGAKEFGDAFARTVAFRTRNFGRIKEKADRKARANGRTGVIHPRVVAFMIEEGSLCDDELMGDYLGGVLAGSISPDGRDDRAITWSRIIGGLSSFQVRAHYLLYREWAARLHEAAPDLDCSYKGKMALAEIFLDLEEFGTALMQDCDENLEVILRHSLFGLTRAGLINDSWFYGARSRQSVIYHDFETFLEVTPTGRGMELYGWATGWPDLLPKNFASKAHEYEPESGIPRLKKVRTWFDIIQDDDSNDDDYPDDFPVAPPEDFYEEDSYSPISD